ncbi:MAG: hypothetical protein PHX10_06545 [Gallionellaceae bacterium]|nr:hypothetical protein [Gallionellaceae bacterium]
MSPEAWSAPRAVLAPAPAADASIPPELAATEANLAEQFRHPPISLDALDRLAEVRARIAEALARAGETERAGEYLLASLDLAPEHGDRWQRLGDLVLLSGRVEDRALAEHAYRQVLSLDPAQNAARIKLASLAIARHGYPEAVRHLEIALAYDEAGPEWLQVATLTGLYALTGQIDQGRKYFSRMARATGDDRFVLADAILLQVSGDGKGAAKRLKDIQEGSITPDLLKRYADQLRGEFTPGLLDGLFKWLK